MSGDSSTDRAEHRADGPLSVEISNRISQIFGEYTGRGASRVKTYLHDDLIVTVLHDTLTKGERRMADLGEMASVVANRRAYQRIMQPDLRAVITELTGRQVLAFMSDQSAEPDVAVEAFVMRASED